MTDLFERQLADQLQRRPLPHEVPGLAQHSIALGQRIRRRRVAGVALALVLLLVVPAAAWTATHRLSADPEPVQTPSPSLAVPSGPMTVILDPVFRPLGPGPYLSTLRDQAICPPSGPCVEAGDDPIGTVAEHRQGFAWLTGSGADLRLNAMRRSWPVPAGAGEARGVEPGPAGSVMVRTKRGPVLLTLDGILKPPSDGLLRTDRMVATGFSLWVETSRGVAQVEAKNLRGGLTNQVNHPQWQEVVVSDTMSDRLVVTDRAGCHIVVNATTAATVWRTCDWKLNAFSPSGRYVAGRHHYGARGVLDLNNSGKWLLAVDNEDNPTGERYAVDDTGRLSMAMGHPSVGFSVASCDLDGTCVMGPHAAGRLEFVLPNR
jgi:hypothetical protein